MEKTKIKIHDLLKWSEKYTKADMIYLARGGFWVTFGQSITSILSLLLLIAFANLLPKETYGTYRYILALAGVLNVFTLTGMNSSVARAVAAGNEGILKASVKYQLKWNLLMLTAFWALGGYYFVNGDIIFATSFFILGIFVPSTLAFNTYGAYLDGKKEFKIANILNVISAIVYVVGVLAVILLNGEVIWLIAAYAVTTFASTLFFYIFVLHKFKQPTATDAKETLKYGRELTFIKLIGPLTSQIDKIILAHFWGAAELATYSLAMAVPSRAISIIKRWVSIGFPKFAAKTPEEINTVFYKRIFQGMSIGAIIALSYILISPYLFKYLLPQYLDGILYSQIIAVSFIFAMPNRYINLLLESQKLSRVIFIKDVINSIMVLSLYIILGIWGGILGLVIAYVSSTFIGMLVNISMWRKNSKV